MMTANRSTIVGVDWGTTHRRAYALDAHGTLLAQWADNDGALACKGRFDAALQDVLTQLQMNPDWVVMSGMVGSALGWQVVPYVSEQLALKDMALHAARPVHSSGVPCLIMPGYCVRNASGQPDVMRGEETQLLGAVVQGHADGWFVLPGTHSKWVELVDGHVRQLRTYMTGELFDLLRQHGTLASAAGAASKPAAAWDDDAFAQGVHSANQGGALSHQLFGVRARVVCADLPAASATAFLSGLLIGSELHDLLGAPTGMRGPSNFKLIGSPQLARLYQSAAARLGIQFEVLDAQSVYLAALAYIRTQLDT